MSNHPFFDKVKLPKLKRNLFDKSHENKFSCNMGYLVPIYIEDVVPGDKYRIQPEIMCRLAPTIAPIMHRVDIYTHTFFVPKRLVWNEFQEYISGGKNGTLQPIKPYFTYAQLKNSGRAATALNGTLLDYLGYPTFSDTGSLNSEVKIDALPLRAYMQIYNDFYRDQNLVAEIPFSKGSGQLQTSDLYTLLELKKRCWHKDYFTSALPFAQRGPEVSLPMGGTAPVVYTGADALNPPVLVNYGNSNESGIVSTGSPNTSQQLRTLNNSDTGAYAYDPKGSLKVDLSNATAVTINALRRASALQKFLERSALGGSRLIESNFVHFGVMGKDYRYQRAEYLGGSCQNMIISEVLQNSISSEQAEKGLGLTGSMSGHGLSANVNKPITKYFDEQGYIITILSVLPRASYQQGLNRMFTRFDRLDEYFPEFAHLGEQEVKKSEVYFDVSATDDSAYNDSTFGYQSRFADMKYQSDEVHGDFKESLDFWHMGRRFNGSGSSFESNTKPLLNSTFLECNPTKRVFNVTLTNYHCLWFDCFIKVKALRPMPIFGTPSF